ncbi:MAG: hypothetical protein EA418_07555 [Wenzhouxiangellaceae bacterium]|nr:MAG: hypothetical protein EA418_07555 [Wenzhouxiangellaceae bacterium]
MTLPSGEFNLSFGISGTRDRTITPPPRYLAQPFEAHVAGSEALVIALQDGSAVKLPLPQGKLLSLCDRLRTLDQHCQRAIKRWSLPAGQAAAVRQGLERLVDQGLLIDEATVASRIASSSPASAPSPDSVNALCVRTCERPRQLESLLVQLGRYTDCEVARHLIVLDDSRDLGTIEQNAAIIEQARSRLSRPVVHITRASRRALIEQIARAAGCSPAELAGLIEGDPDDTSPSYGAGLNLALLLNAGRRFVMIDDDTDLAVYAIADDAPTARLCENQVFRSLFPDPAKRESEQFPALNIDPLRSHVELLGRHPDDLDHLPGLKSDQFLNDVSPQLLHELTQTPTPRIRLTANGTLGDVGTGSMAWLFALPANEFAALADSPESYRHLAYSRRMARCAPQLQIGSPLAFMTTTLTGIDNRELLLPTVAKGRGEDMVFAASTRFLHPGALLASQPWMLGHRLDQPRRWSESDLAKGITINPATYLSAKIKALSERELAADALTRSDLLSASMANLAAMKREAVGIDLRRHIVNYRLQMAAMIAETMHAVGPPAWLRKDFETLLNRHSSLDDWGADRVDQVARLIQHQAAVFANGLRAWCKAWQWCADQSGPNLLERVDQGVSFPGG